LQAHPPIPP